MILAPEASGHSSSAVNTGSSPRVVNNSSRLPLLARPQRASAAQAVLAAAAVLCWASLTPLPASAQPPVPPAAEGPPTPSLTARLQTLERARAAVVGLRIDVVDGARSAESLGTRRVGSGVVIGDDGLILTIGYLLIEAESIEVTISQGRSVPARTVAYDLATGFGLVRPLVPLRGVVAARLGSSGALTQGELVLAGIGGAGEGTGAAIGITQLVSKRAFSGYWEYHIESALFTSPALPNHSGAPLFNQEGELIGIGSLFTADAAGGARRGLAGNMFVPVDLLKPVLAELQATGSTRASRRPWLGLTSSEQAGRVEIVRVNRDSPASAAGLQSGDVVLEIDGTKVATLEAFYKQLWTRGEPETDVRLTVQRGSDVRTFMLRSIDRMQTMRKPSGI